MNKLEHLTAENIALVEALTRILDICPPCSGDSTELAFADPLRGEAMTWHRKLRDAQRVALVALRNTGRKV